MMNKIITTAFIASVIYCLIDYARLYYTYFSLFDTYKTGIEKAKENSVITFGFGEPISPLMPHDYVIVYFLGCTVMFSPYLILTMLTIHA